MAAHPRLRRFLGASALLLSTLVILAQGARLLGAIQHGAATTTDFCLDYQTAQHWLHGARIYTPVTCWSRFSSTPVPVEYYAHPPFSLFVAVPFALLSASLATWLWGLLSLGCLVLSFLLVCRELDLRRPGIALPLLALFLLWDPTMGSASAENIGGGVTCLLVTFVWRELRRGQQGRAGLLAGLVILLKPVPFLLLPFFALRRQWRAAIASLLTLAGGVVISAAVMGPAAWLDYLGPARADEGFAVAVPSNLAIEGYLVRWINGYHEFLHPGAGRAFIDLPPLFTGLSLEASLLLGYLLVGVVLLIFGFWLWKRAPAQPAWGDDDDASFAAVLLLTMLAFPSAWDWSLALIIMPVLWLGVKIVQRNASRTTLLLYGAAIILLAIPFSWLIPAFQLQAQTSLPWALRLAGALLTTLPTIALVLLLAALWPWLKATAPVAASQQASEQIAPPARQTV
ncbi:MAG TPA: glycosyltransferase family 87 protein [Ktedonobacterales bacterium]|nr:glycosyltransferase family 87 protein [Ktedonobacterales bacterium]